MLHLTFLSTGNNTYALYSNTMVFLEDCVQNQDYPYAFGTSALGIVSSFQYNDSIYLLAIQNNKNKMILNIIGIYIHLKLTF